MRKAIISACAVVVLAMIGLVVLSAGDKVESAVIKVYGMSCDNCVSKIESTLSELDGVKSVTVSLEDKIARVSYLASQTDVPRLEKAIAKLGYDAGATKAEAAHNDRLLRGEACKKESAAGCCGEKSVQPST
jgi:copper ion binding protein